MIVLFKHYIQQCLVYKTNTTIRLYLLFPYSPFINASLVQNEATQVHGAADVPQ